MRVVFPATFAEPWIGPIDRLVAERFDSSHGRVCTGNLKALICRRNSPEDAQTLSRSLPDNSIESAGDSFVMPRVLDSRTRGSLNIK